MRPSLLQRPGSPSKRDGSYARPASPSKDGGEGGQADPAEQYARVAALYRKAAGLYQHIEEELFPAAAEELPRDRPGGTGRDVQHGCTRLADMRRPWGTYTHRRWLA